MTRKKSVIFFLFIVKYLNLQWRIYNWAYALYEVIAMCASARLSINSTKKQSRCFFWIAARLTGVRDDLLKIIRHYLFVFGSSKSSTDNDEDHPKYDFRSPLSLGEDLGEGV